jgi:1,4-dihydroxy-2-naphthoate octaprenyltransferase
VPDRRATLRAWVIGARLHTLPAAAAPVLVGGGLAAWRRGFAPAAFAAALAGALLIQIGTNFANDYHDFHRGADTEDRQGFVRVTQAGLVPPGRVRGWMMQSFALALLPGAYLAWVAGWPVVLVGLASIVAGLAYTGGPWPLAYHGLGEPFVFLFFGLVAVSMTEYVQTLRFDPPSLVAGAGVGALTTAILVVNNLRDIPTDRQAGKHTLAVRLGEKGSRLEFEALLVMALAAPIVGVALCGWPAASLLGSAALLFALAPLRTVRGFRDRTELNGALSGTGRALLAYGIALAVGLAL